jgi:DNA-directed RNA polymerase subunit N (RpoN/RPB10)
MSNKFEVLDRMDLLIGVWKPSNDARQIFLSCYRLMTGNMLNALDKGAFHDPEWINTLLHNFADYYFDALACYDCGKPVSKVWQEVHQYTNEKKLRHVQYLLMGVNAHINYDLVLTLYDMLHEDWKNLSKEEQILRYQDHCKVNEIIAASIDEVQDELLSPSDPVMGWIDTAFGRVDEYLLSRLITSWRQEVWDQACVLMSSSDMDEQENIRLKLENSVLKRNHLISLDFF